MRMMLSLAALSLLLGGCNKELPVAEQAPVTRPDAAATAPAAASKTPATAASRAVTLRRAGGADAMTVALKGTVVEVALSDHGGRSTLHGETYENGKRKYWVDEGDVQFEVKPGDGGDFKLRGADGSLRWKVKVDADKIRISNNEQNDNPFELKVREGDRVKVVGPGDRELGNVHFDRAASKIAVENAAGQTLFTADAQAPSSAWGILLLDAIPDVQRQILVAEILARGR